MPAAWKRIFIMLNPKKQDASKVSHYKFISLGITLYKIYTKILMGKMKPILSHLINSE